MLIDTQPRAPRPARRRRRIYWTLAILSATALLGTALGVRAWRAQQPAEYRPGEEDADITRKLEQPAAPAAPAARPAGGGPSGLRTSDRAMPAGAPAPRLVDVTRQAGLEDFRTFAGRRTSQLPEDMGGGAAWGDFDNDGYDDLFLVSAGGPMDAPAARLAPSLLYRNQRDGTFRRVEEFPELRIQGMGAAGADYNNDGWLDLVVTGYNTLLLFRNDHGRLVRDTRFPNPKGFWTGAAWGDYDRDGFPDLYVCAYVNYSVKPGSAGSATKQFGLEVPYTLNPSSFEPARNLLFHNNGNGTFSETATRLGIANPEGRSLSAIWHDFDQDGWPDLYVANDVSENKLYLNKGGKFADAGHQAWIAEYRGSMGLAVGDWDNDGDDDVFISHWIAQQFALYNSLQADQKRAARHSDNVARHAAELHFMDVAEMAGIGQVSLQSIGWGTEFVDLDGDGFLDLLVAAGSTFEREDDRTRLRPMESFLFWNRQGKAFQNLAPWNQSLATPHVSRGLAAADYDNDGAVDVAVVDLDGGVRLLHNRMQTGHWAELRLRSRAAGRDSLGYGDGATVVVRAGGKEMRRSVTSASYLSQSSRRLHFGLGTAERIDSAEVHWMGGAVETFRNLDAGAIWELTQGDPLPRRFGAQPAPSSVGALPQERQLAFWEKQRAGMDAMKRERNVPRAAALFREALAIDPAHEDSHYYLANCLATMGDEQGALAQLDELIRLNPHSHRAWQRRALLLAASAKTRAGLQAAEESAGKALAINGEETGSLVIQGEIALAMGNAAQARQRLEWACRSNPRAVGALFLRGYLEYAAGDMAGARDLLGKAKAARGAEWKPKGSVMEGDVRKQMHAEAAFLASFWEHWDGGTEPAAAFRPLRAFLARVPR